MPKDKMKPCPFCGGEAELVKSIRPWIRCKQCYAQRHILVWTHMIDEIEAVIKAWNTRPTPASEGSITDWEKEFDDYWHIGQAQILSGKISKVDFKRNIKAFIRKLLEVELCHICKRPKKEIGGQFCSASHPVSHGVLEEEISQVKAQCAEELMGIVKGGFIRKTDIHNLIKKWRGK